MGWEWGGRGGGGDLGTRDRTGMGVILTPVKTLRLQIDLQMSYSCVVVFLLKKDDQLDDKKTE